MGLYPKTCKIFSKVDSSGILDVGIWPGDKVGYQHIIHTNPNPNNTQIGTKFLV